MSLKDLFAARKPIVEKVELPPEMGEWFVRELDAPELTRFHRYYDQHKQAGRELVWFVALAACDADGVRVFEDADVAGVLLHVPGWVVSEVWTAGGKLNRLTKGAVEETEKNSDATP